MTRCGHTLLKRLKVLYDMDFQELTGIVEKLGKSIYGGLTQEEIDIIVQIRRNEAKRNTSKT